VAGDLAQHLIGEDFSAFAAKPLGHDRDRGLIASGFNAQNAHANSLRKKAAPLNASPAERSLYRRTAGSWKIVVGKGFTPRILSCREYRRILMQR
jgi:phosphohistidine phosphatase SixA